MVTTDQFRAGTSDIVRHVERLRREVDGLCEDIGHIAQKVHAGKIPRVSELIGILSRLASAAGTARALEALSEVIPNGDDHTGKRHVQRIPRERLKPRKVF